MNSSTDDRAGWVLRDMHGRPVAIGRTPESNP